MTIVLTLHIMYALSNAIKLLDKLSSTNEGNITLNYLEIFPKQKYFNEIMNISTKKMTFETFDM